ncbi:hypothetical protein DVH05_014749 [Phytophthora capsici]|nr:hypothetical protein DVH05_016411 [Phytophthora capsici]KAG1698794.1 hypothetical protein DVH05_014749 [Phytophthora capsici]
MQTKFMQAYLQVPGVLEALQLLRSKQAEGQKAEELFEDNNHGLLNEEHEEQVDEQIEKPTAAEAGPAPAISWPASIMHSLELTVKDGDQVKDTWPADRCIYYIDCYPDTCLNAVGTLFCKPENCNLRGRCSNSVYETCHAELIKSEIGVGVRATELIPAGATVAPYTGLLTDFDYNNQDRQYEYVVSLQTKGRGNKRLYIDAQEWGTLAHCMLRDGSEERFLGTLEELEANAEVIRLVLVKLILLVLLTSLS